MAVHPVLCRLDTGETQTAVAVSPESHGLIGGLGDLIRVDHRDRVRRLAGQFALAKVQVVIACVSPNQRNVTIEESSTATIQQADTAVNHSLAMRRKRFDHKLLSAHVAANNVKPAGDLRFVGRHLSFPCAYAPCNWTSGDYEHPVVASTDWEQVQRVELIADYAYDQTEEERESERMRLLCENAAKEGLRKA